MSSSKRVWEAPVAAALSIRSTASLTGGGADNFARYDVIHRPGITPAAPLVDVGARPVPASQEAVKVAETDRAWEAPAVTQLSI